MTHDVWDWMVANVPVDSTFTSASLTVPGISEEHLRSALSDLRRRYKVLEVIDKQGRFYIYRLVSLEPAAEFGTARTVPAGYHRGPRAIKRHVLSKGDFYDQVLVPKTVTTVTDERNGIEHTTHHEPRTDRFAFPVTGRVSSGQPELQDLRPQGQQVERIVEMDFTHLEERVVAHMLSQLTDDQLLAELKRRMNHGD